MSGARGRLAVLMGGRSSEHEVSRASAAAVMAALDPERYEVTPVTIDREGAWRAGDEPVALVPGPDGRGVLISLDGGPERTIDVVFPVLHGPYGEDGTVQGLCEMARVPYVGAGVCASAAAMDKAIFKCLARDAGLPVAEWVVVTAREWREHPEAVREAVAGAVGYPAFCKPARLGSSVGISRVLGPDALDAALHLALAHDDKALVERAVSGREVEVGVLGVPQGPPRPAATLTAPRRASPRGSSGDAELIVSPPGEIVYAGDWYDYEVKYSPGLARLEVPADLPEDVAQRARALAERAFRAVDCAGMARADFFVTPDGEVIVSELNTIPGFTDTSAYATLIAAAGVGYGELLDRLVDLALERAAGAALLRA